MGITSLNIKRIILLLLAFLFSYIASKYVNKFYKQYPKISKKTVRFRIKTHDFGEIKESEKASHYFVYKNISRSNLEIRSVRSNCGCTVPSWSMEKLHPNAIDSILVVYDTRKSGRFSKEIYINYVNSSFTDTLKITGIVLTN